MRIIEPSFEIIDPIDGDKILQKLELCGRICYKSEEVITDQSAKKFISNIIKSGHESVLEHQSISIRYILDRGISHELVRHRIASYSQESTRYVTYGANNKHEMLFVKPDHIKKDTIDWDEFVADCEYCERSYLRKIERGIQPQQARYVLNTAIKTEVICTMNIRELRHMLRLRCHPTAHPDIRRIMIPTAYHLQDQIPVIFDDIVAEINSYNK